MHRILRPFLALTAIVSVGAMLMGSATAGDSKTSPNIHSIVILAPDNPTHFGLAIGNLGTALLAGTYAGPGGISGELEGTRAESGARPELTNALQGKAVRLGDELAAALSQRLSETGYSVSVLHVTREKPNSLLRDYKAVTESADAILDVAIREAGYERRVWGHIAPNVLVDVSLVDKASGRKLLKKTYYYDPSARTIGRVMLRPAKEFGFKTEEEVLAHPDVVARGLRGFIPLLVDDFTGRLSR